MIFAQDYSTNRDSSLLPQCPSNLLHLLVVLVERDKRRFPQISSAYYTYLSTLCSENNIEDKGDALISAITVPLIQHVETSNGNYQPSYDTIPSKPRIT